FRSVHFDADRVKKGLIMMAWGFFLKLVVADRLGVYVDVLHYNAADYRGLPLLIGSYFFLFQIYYDFSGYCSIAIGAAQIMGYNLMQNFNLPFFFYFIGDFWRKWYISIIILFSDFIFFLMLCNYKF